MMTRAVLVFSVPNSLRRGQNGSNEKGNTPVPDRTSGQAYPKETCMSLTDVLMVAAVLLAPLIAIQVSVFLETRREKRQRRLNLFRTLMMTRAARLVPDHVNALNMIDIEFSGTDAESKEVRAAWKAYLDILNSADLSSEIWNEKAHDLFVDLLYHLAVHVGYDFDRTHLRRNAYFPRGFGETELDQLAIRTGVRELLEGKRALPVWVPQPDQSSSAGQALPSSQHYSRPQSPESTEG